MKRPPLTPEQKDMLTRCINTAHFMGEIPLYSRSADYQPFIRRARAALQRNLEEPGDCKGDLPLLAALSVAEAQIGRGAGWIPVVQKLACEITRALGL